MEYRQFGKTGEKISLLGFGAMRLPMYGEDEDRHVKREEAVDIIRRALELGVNYVDTAWGYCNRESQPVVGEAIRDRRGSVLLSTKLPTWLVEKTSDYRRLLEEQLSSIGTDWIDFYHFHGLNKDRFENIVLKYRLLDEAVKAKEAGLIRHISFSFHDKPDVMKRIIDTGVFESVLCQYNLLDTANEDAIRYAVEKGLGVVAMGPVGGGRLGVPSEVMQNIVESSVETTVEIALRFVFANSNIHCALSGMGSIAMVEQNAEIASRGTSLSDSEKARVLSAMEETKRLADLYCTGCEYCMPCPNGVNIPGNFALMNYHKVYGLTDYAKAQYGKMKPEARATACVECGECEPKCPQNIEIIKQLSETAAVLGG